MNWLLILIVIVLAGNIVWGFGRGFVRVLYSMLAWIVILFFVTWATPYVTDFLEEQTTLDERIEAGCEEKFHELVQKSSDKLFETEKSELNGEAIQFPKALLEKIFGTDQVADQYLEQSGVYQEVAEQTTDVAMRGIAFAITFILTWIVSAILSRSLDLVNKLPLIGSVNHFLGGAAGAVKGMLLIWLFFAFIAVSGMTTVGTALISLIYESELLVWLYENNLVLAILLLFL